MSDFRPDAARTAQNIFSNFLKNNFSLMDIHIGR
jgi:hypothetical protein